MLKGLTAEIYYGLHKGVNTNTVGILHPRLSEPTNECAVAGVLWIDQLFAKYIFQINSIKSHSVDLDTNLQNDLVRESRVG